MGSSSICPETNSCSSLLQHQCWLGVEFRHYPIMRNLLQSPSQLLFTNKCKNKQFLLFPVSAHLHCEQIEKQIILADFDNKINIWCELYAQINHLPKDMMCALAVKEFKDFKSAKKIRKAVKQEYKPRFRVENAKKKKVLTNSDKKLLKRIKDAMIVNAGGIASPFYESLILLTKNASKE